jgi:predicted nuclease of predicted toxin-antitoxin system
MNSWKRLELILGLGPPPSVIWVTCGNRSKPALKELMIRSWPRVKDLLAAGEVLIEINEVRAR